MDSKVAIKQIKSTLVDRETIIQSVLDEVKERKLLHIQITNKHVFLLICHVEDASNQLKSTGIKENMVDSTLIKCEKLKSSLKPWGLKGYYILEKDLQKSCSDDGFQVDIKSSQIAAKDDLQEVKRFMEICKLAYLEIDTQEDIDEDSGQVQPGVFFNQAASLEDIPTTSSTQDPKKNPEFLRILNIIRRLMGHTEDFPPDFPPDEQPDGDNDLEEDRGGEETDTVPLDYYGQPARKFIVTEPQKQHSLNIQLESEPSDSIVDNLDFLLGSPPAQQMLGMDYDKQQVRYALSTFLASNGHTRYTVEDLIEAEEPK